jgi:hypothetical protein
LEHDELKVEHLWYHVKKPFPQWVMAMPNGSPTPTCSPSSLQISTWAFEAPETASVGGVRARGTPPTPIPILACTGMLEFSEQDFVKVTDRATFQGSDLFVTILIAGPKKG